MSDIVATMPNPEALTEADYAELCFTADDWVEVAGPRFAPVAARLKDFAMFEFAKANAGQVGPTRLSLPLDDLTDEEIIEFGHIVRDRLERPRAQAGTMATLPVFRALAVAFLSATRQRSDTMLKLREVLEEQN